MKRCNHDRRLQVLFMSVDPETIPEEDYFRATKTFVEKYKKTSTPRSVPKHWLEFSCIYSEYYELDMNFDGT